MLARHFYASVYLYSDVSSADDSRNFISLAFGVIVVVIINFIIIIMSIMDVKDKVKRRHRQSADGIADQCRVSLQEPSQFL